VIALSGPADRTENVLHRLEFSPFIRNISTTAVAVVMVGANNIVLGDPASSVYKAIGLIAKQW
jgi:hypothetical protein